jgi:hypothetical protein
VGAQEDRSTSMRERNQGRGDGGLDFGGDGLDLVAHGSGGGVIAPPAGQEGREVK